jgi:NADPH-dependent stearoyl-CoA 9-desaturase
MTLPYRLAPDQVEALGRELTAIRERTLAEVGEEDARYIRRMVRVQRALEYSGRALLYAWVFPPAWGLGVAALGLAKILDNMEIGHNIIHGQYDFMRDPAFSSRHFEWDACTPAAHWRHSHNYLHHAHSNILGKDRDIGYSVVRVSEEQPWELRYIWNPIRALLTCLFFDVGIAFHDLELDRIRLKERTWDDIAEPWAQVKRKMSRQFMKDFVLFPLLGGPLFLPILLGNALANIMRNIWAFTIIFCGHFPSGVAVFREEDVENETQGGWYIRQLLGSANIEGGRLFHVLTGNLSHQIEHHLFPDVPARRYASIAPEVREICERYGLAYNTGSLSKQFGSVIKRIFRLALPDSVASAKSALSSS